MIDKAETAREGIANAITKRQGELDVLMAAYEMMGGSLEDEVAAAGSNQLLLTGPKTKKRRKAKKGGRRTKTTARVERGKKVTFTLNGHPIEVSERHNNLIAILRAAGSVPVAKADLLSCFTGKTPNFHQTKEALNEKLKPAGVYIANVRGEGWRLEKLP